MTSYVTPKYATAYVFYVSLEDQANPGLFKASPTLAAGDVIVATDDGSPGNITTLPTVDGDFTKRVKVSLSATEMTGANVTVIFSDASGAEWYDLEVNLQTTARQIDDLSTLGGTAQTGDAYAVVSHTDYGNAKLVRSTTPANTLDVSATGEAGLDFANIKAATSPTTLTNITVPTVTTLTGHTAQTGDAYAEVTNATYGLNKLARTGADSDTLKTLSDQIDGVSAGTIAAAVWAVASGSGTEDTYGNILDDLTEESGGTYRFTTAALSQAPGGGGTTYSDTITVTDGSNPIDGVFIELSTDSGKTNIIYSGTTNASGQLTVYSDTAGTHYAWMQLAGYTFTNPTSVTLA